MNSIEKIIRLSQDDKRIWTGTVIPNNAWWVPIEYERNHTSAAEAIIKLTGGVPGYTIDIGPKRREMTRQEFRIAAFVMTYLLLAVLIAKQVKLNNLAQLCHNLIL